MKKVIILSMALFLLFSISFVGRAASLESEANIYAEVLSPVTISTESDLNFGTLAASSQNNGSVTIDGNGNFTLADIPYHDNTNGSLASFSVSYPEYANRTNQSIVQTNVDLSNGTDLINVTNFTIYNLNTTTANQITTFNFDVGATLNVAANQPSGSYSGTFDVTVVFE